MIKELSRGVLIAQGELILANFSILYIWDLDKEEGLTSQAEYART